MSYQQLWAPWRLDYILESKQKDRSQPGTGQDHECFLCRYRDDHNDAENLVAARNRHSLTVLNRYPYNNGHLLIAPADHKGTLEELGDEELLGCMQEVRRMTGVLQKILTPEGFNIGLNLGQVAGAGLPGHLHWHIVPRWSGDSSFMTVLAEVNVIPQSLQALYNLMQAELAE